MGILLASALLLAQSTLSGQSQVRDLGAGSFLVAHRDLPDPNFAETVVLLVDYNSKGAMGLIINRQTRIPISRVFEDPAVRQSKDRIFEGGPVGRTGILGLLRTKAKPEDAKSVFADVYLVTSKALLDQSIAGGADSKTFRVYLGYSGWAPGQLESEVERGGWHIFRGDADAVFAADPGGVWDRLIRRTETRIARRRPTAEGFPPN